MIQELKEVIKNQTTGISWEEAQKLQKNLQLAAERAVNIFGVNARKMAAEWLEEMGKDGEQLVAFAAAWVYTWGTWANAPQDGRNEIAVAECARVSKNPAFDQYARDNVFREREEGKSKQEQEMGSLMFMDFMGFARLNGARMHRTLMQSFTSIMLQVLKTAHPEWELNVPERLPLI